jgi:hypothetical protein
MRKVIFALIVVMISTTGLAGCKGKTEEAIYTCPMHPEVQQKEPGQCPKCGMDLEKKQ